MVAVERYNEQQSYNSQTRCIHCTDWRLARHVLCWSLSLSYISRKSNVLRLCVCQCLGLIDWLSRVFRGWVRRKTGHWMSRHNFGGKCEPVYKILSPKKARENTSCIIIKTPTLSEMRYNTISCRAGDKKWPVFDSPYILTFTKTWSVSSRTWPLTVWSRKSKSLVFKSQKVDTTVTPNKENNFQHSNF